MPHYTYTYLRKSALRGVQFPSQLRQEGNPTQRRSCRSTAFAKALPGSCKFGATGIANTSDGHKPFHQVSSLARSLAGSLTGWLAGWLSIIYLSVYVAQNAAKYIHARADTNTCKCVLQFMNSFIHSVIPSFLVHSFFRPFHSAGPFHP